MTLNFFNKKINKQINKQINRFDWQQPKPNSSTSINLTIAKGNGNSETLEKFLFSGQRESLTISLSSGGMVSSRRATMSGCACTNWAKQLSRS